MERRGGVILENLRVEIGVLHPHKKSCRRAQNWNVSSTDKSESNCFSSVCIWFSSVAKPILSVLRVLCGEQSALAAERDHSGL
ncbi:MAG: hypothetical protein ABSH08_13210 [Tepidisphaeraceae bacterium]|jgi:hypothetical protein